MNKMQSNGINTEEQILSLKKEILKLKEQNYKLNQKLVEWKTRAKKIPIIMEKEYTEFIKNL